MIGDITMEVTCENINCPYIAICDIRVSDDDDKNLCAYAKSFIDKANKEKEGEYDGEF